MMMISFGQLERHVLELQFQWKLEAGQCGGDGGGAADLFTRVRGAEEQMRRAARTSVGPKRSLFHAEDVFCGRGYAMENEAIEDSCR
ncbi:unnamed protein product [Lampetra fluviatilis]